MLLGPIRCYWSDVVGGPSGGIVSHLGGFDNGPSSHTTEADK
jgi:hypothetical protein